MKKCIVLLLCWLLQAVVVARADSCSWQFAGGVPPEILNPGMAVDTTLLCYDAYAVMPTEKIDNPFKD